MRQWIVFVFWTVAVPTLAVAGCDESSSRSVAGSGHVITEQRPLAAFQQVELEGEGHLIIGPDEPAALEVRTDDNLMALVETKVVDGKLVIGIKPNRNLQPTDGVTYRVACDQVSGLRLSGSGEIEVNSCTASDLTVGLDGSGRVRVDGVDATRVDAEIGGSGTIRVSGTSTQVGVSVAGSGIFDGGELQAQQVEAMIPGSGQIVVWATGTLRAGISGSGSVLYRGRPAVTQDISGSGAVTPLNDG
jgi:Putative auto-transporter adhesin, head GIN domain